LRKKAFNIEPQTLGEHIKKRRLELGFSQKEVGEMLGVTSFTVLNWEKGKTEPLGRLMRRILDFMNQELEGISANLERRRGGGRIHH
jgi:transcriptional regulator with XRE-family HTH domain